MFVFVFVSFGNENADIQQIIQEEMQMQLLQALGDKEFVENDDNAFENDILNILEENNEIMADELEEEKEKSDLQKEEEKIAEEKYKQKKKAIQKQKEQNKNMTGYFGLGVNYPIFLGFDSSNDDFEIVSPVGFVGSVLTSKSYIALKLDFEFDLVKYLETDKDNSVFTTFSVGCTPVHNDFLFLGIFGTVGFDSIGDCSYTSVGGSGTCIWHCSNFLGVFLDLNVTKRVVGKVKDSKIEDDSIIPRYTGTWRISPSVGLTIILLQ